MSFSKDVKEELSLQISSARHCRIAELTAMLLFGGRIYRSGNRIFIKLQTDSITVARKYFTLIRKTFNIKISIMVRRNSSQADNQVYMVLITNQAHAKLVLQAIKFPYDNMKDGDDWQLNQLIVQNACCKRAFIRGAFIAIGSMSNPKKAYHLEFVTPDAVKAAQLIGIIEAFSIDAKSVMRKKSNVVYIKEGSQIVDLLNVMEAHVALMDLENVRILKEMRNSINRQVNCEAANITKTVTAASKQIEDIIYIRDHYGFGGLAEGLEEMATMRLQHPEASLKELGTMLTSPIGKSGVNHRLRKLSMIAESLREHKEEEKL